MNLHPESRVEEMAAWRGVATLVNATFAAM